MKRYYVVLAVACLCVAAVCFASDQAEMPALLSPQQQEISGTTDAYLSPAYFPKFKKSEPVTVNGKVVASDNPECEAWLENWTATKNVSVCEKSAKGNGQYHPLCCCSNTGLLGQTKTDAGGTTSMVRNSCESTCLASREADAKECGCKEKCCAGKGKAGAYVALEGLHKVIRIPKQYVGSSKILVTWNVRIESVPYTVEYWPYLCTPYHGPAKYVFPDAPVRTQLNLNGKDKGEEFSMVVPGSAGSALFAHDPVLTGSFLLTPDLYKVSDEKTESDGTVTVQVAEVQVMWKNDTAMLLKSPANNRNILIEVMPIGGNPVE